MTLEQTVTITKLMNKHTIISFYIDSLDNSVILNLEDGHGMVVYPDGGQSASWPWLYGSGSRHTKK